MEGLRLKQMTWNVVVFMSVNVIKYILYHYISNDIEPDDIDYDELDKLLFTESIGPNTNKLS